MCGQIFTIYILHVHFIYLLIKYIYLNFVLVVFSLV